MALSRARLSPGRGSRSDWLAHRFQRHVLVDGQDVGLVSIDFTTQDKPGTELWARPYFDPRTKELCLQGQDGQEVGPRKSLILCATGEQLRPLLHLARAEELIESIPGTFHSTLLTIDCDC